jgi:uncharacterized Ntn-hydrolase superfamily protein
MRHLLLLLLFTTLLRADELPIVATFSIVACDPATGELGVAVQSKFVAVGAVVPYAKAGVGAVATQALANTIYGPVGLKLLSEGKSPDEIVKQLTDADPKKSQRQLGIIDSKGNAATFTGDQCFDWAGGIAGKNFAVQGNILTSEEVIKAMAKAFEESKGEFAQRLIDALRAGQVAGGDKRGRQSAALLVVQEGGGYSALNDRKRDLRVDDHPHPIEELQRIYELHKNIFPDKP